MTTNPLRILHLRVLLCHLHAPLQPLLKIFMLSVSPLRDLDASDKRQPHAPPLPRRLLGVMCLRSRLPQQHLAQRRRLSQTVMLFARQLPLLNPILLVVPLLQAAAPHVPPRQAAAQRDLHQPVGVLRPRRQVAAQELQGNVRPPDVRPARRFLRPLRLLQQNERRSTCPSAR